MYKAYKSDQIAQVVFAKSKSQALAKNVESHRHSGVEKRAVTENGKPECKAGSQSWRDILNSVAEMDLWGAERREDRPKWKEYLRRAEELIALPRTNLPQNMVEAALTGDFSLVDDKKLPSMKKKVVVFVSSTFTDTKAERNTLIKDVNPYLRSLCRVLGLDFGCVDMRWGVNEETTMSHATAAVCTDEVDRCIRESGGPAFLAILGHKYGYQPFPSEIGAEEFKKIKQHLDSLGKDTSLLEEYYRLDENMVPPHYILKSRDSRQKDWWDIFGKIQELFRTAAPYCLSEEDAQKYFISVTEQEMQHGIFQNESRNSQVTLVRKYLKDVRDVQHHHRHIIDMVSGEIDEESQKSLEALKEEKSCEKLENGAVLDVNYEVADKEKVIEYVRLSCDAICESLAESVLKNYRENLHKAEDATFSEVVQHADMAQEKYRMFVGRELLIQKTKDYLSARSKKPFVVHGQSGCGKTALMAMCMKQAKDYSPGSVTVLRFIGTTGNSSAARSLLRSLCEQISRAYGKDATEVPDGYKELVPFFKTCLDLSSESQPLYLFLDSLDQLSNEDFGKNLKWMSLKEDLPTNTHIVVSTLPGQCLEILRGFLPEENFMEVQQLNEEDGHPMLKSMLEMSQRTLTEEQTRTVLASFRSCPLPLYMRLAVDVALRWHSYDSVSADELAPDMPGLVNTLFQRLESKYGKKLVHHALAYITVAKHGLSVAELEDILSCDNDVLTQVFSFWIPPFIRIPPLLWIRIRNELGPYLVERGADGVNTYGWYHRQFWETAERRFLKQSPDSEISFECEARQTVADYFEGKWFHGKEFMWTKAEYQCQKMENRQVSSQPIVIVGNRQVGRTLNRRKLSELSHQLLFLQDWAKFKELIGTLEFIEAKFEVDQGYECVAEFTEASKSSDDITLKALANFIGANVSHIVKEPDSIYQLASQQTSQNPVRLMFDQIDRDSLSHIIVSDKSPSDVEDPCQLTLRGHTSGVRSCCYSPSGDLIASCAEDGSLRIWDAFSGAEVITVTDLPGPTYPGLADPYHGERPCCFAPSGKYVATGSEDGWLQVWDLAGAEVHKDNTHTDAITGVVYLNDNELISCSKDSTAKFWHISDSGMIQVISVDMGMKGLGCDISTDGSKLAVGCYGGLAVLSTSEHQLLSMGSGYTSNNLGACFSPSGEQVATGGDNSSITLWNAITGQAEGLMTGHSGWVWCVRYTRDGSKLVSCSSDRTIKLWNMDDRSCIASVGGHLHRVSWASVKPGFDDAFVTGSLDFSLKIWDMQAVVNGMVPPVGGLHFTLLRVSPDCRFTASSQGWSTSCTLSVAETGKNIGHTADHAGFSADATFLPDSSIVVTVDTGHRGSYDKDSVYNASAYVTSIPVCDVKTQLATTAPTTVGCSQSLIFIGTTECRVDVFDAGTYEKVASWGFRDMGSPVLGDNPYINSVSAQPHGHVAMVVGPVIKVFSVSDTDHKVALVTELSSASKDVLSVCLYSADGRYLVAADMNGHVCVWDSRQGYDTVCHYRAHVGMLRHLAFSPSVRFLATVGVDMSVKVVDVNDGFKAVCAWYGPVNQMGFIQERTLVLAEATGNKRYVQF